MPSIFKGREISLDELLQSRDARSLRQREILGRFPEAALLCLTVILPGPVKRDSRSLVVAGAAMEAISERIGEVLHSEVHDLDTGFEAYYAVGAPAAEVKRLCCEIEDTHPLGRLMDLDVIVQEEDGLHPLPRGVVGLAERGCLVCGSSGRGCARSRAHSLGELNAKIASMLSDYSSA